MYSIGDEFEKLIEDDLEYLTCIANINVDGNDYIICENENGDKRVFAYDSLSDELEDIDEDEVDDVLSSWENDIYNDGDEYGFWIEDYAEYDENQAKEEKLEYDGDEIYSTDVNFTEDTSDFDDLGAFFDESDIDDFIEDLLD